MRLPSTPSTLTAALELVELGWTVIPVQEFGPRAKSPYTRHGHKDATGDPDQIRAWWARWPNAMIGARVPDSLSVLDIDPRNGGSLEALETLAGPIPETLTCWTGRGDGGRHLYYLRPLGELTSTRLPEGIDLKANGYVIVPPSLHPATGEPYRWESCPIARLTPRLRELLRPAVSRPNSRGSGRDGSPLVRLVTGLKDGERNQGLFWAACRAADTDTLGEVEDDLIAAAVATGLPEREALRTIASAVRTVGGRR